MYTTFLDQAPVELKVHTAILKLNRISTGKRELQAPEINLDEYYPVFIIYSFSFLTFSRTTLLGDTDFTFSSLWECISL
jgi:hypothetical protein